MYAPRANVCTLLFDAMTLRDDESVTVTVSTDFPRLDFGAAYS